MEHGKVSIDILKPILENINTNNSNKEVIQSPEIGVDCAVLDFEKEYVFVSSDPITGATNNIGELVVDVNANDIYASNGIPVGIVLTVLMPVNSTKEDLEEIMNDINKKCKDMNITIIGGHTEVTDAVTRPVVSATILGKSKNKKLLKKQNIGEGFDIVLTKNIALEGTNILACDGSEFLKRKGVLREEELAFGENLTQFLSIKDDCKIAFEHDENIYLHDVTEGGVFGGLYEMFEHLDFGFEVYVEKIPVLEVTKKICKVFNLDPYRLISSGSLLIVCENGDKLVNSFSKNNILANVIGKVTKGNEKIIIEKENEVLKVKGKEKNTVRKLLEQPKGDELFKVDFNNL